MLLLAIVGYVVLASSRSINHSIEQFRSLDHRLHVLQTLVDTLPGGVATVDATNGKIVYVNQGFTEIVQQDRRSLLNSSMLRLIPEEHREFHADLLSDPMQWWHDLGSEKLCLPQAKILRPDGSVIGCELIITPVEIDGNREWQLFIDPTSLVTGS